MGFFRISVEQKLKSVVDDDHFHGGGKIWWFFKYFYPKQSKSLFGLSAFCRVLKLFPDVRARCIVVLAFKNGHANRHHHSRKKFRWNRSEEWLEVAMGRKKDRQWKHQSVYSKNMKLCVMIQSFLSIFEVKLELQNAPDCTDLHLDFKTSFPGGHAPGPPYNWVHFPLFGLSLNPTPGSSCSMLIGLHCTHDWCLTSPCSDCACQNTQ